MAKDCCLKKDAGIRKYAIFGTPNIWSVPTSPLPDDFEEQSDKMSAKAINNTDVALKPYYISDKGP